MAQAVGLQRRPRFDARSVHVRSVMDQVAVGQVSLKVHRVSPVSAIPPLLCTHPHLHVAGTVTEGSLGTFQKAALCIGYKIALT